MKSKVLSAPLASLTDYLNRLSARAPAEELKERLSDLDVCAEDLHSYVRFSEDRYLRNLICEGPFYHLLVLCWRSGQRSPIHNHAGSTCGFRIIEGIATETLFAPTPSRLMKPVSSTDYPEGLVNASQDAFVHQISNLQRPNEDLVTLHVYSPPLLRMDTYSLTEPTIGEYRPMVLEHALGSGI